MVAWWFTIATYITDVYLISDDGQCYKGMVKTHEDLLLLNAVNQVQLVLSGNTIISCEKE